MPVHPTIQTMLDKAALLPPMHTLPVATIRAGDMARYTLGVPPDVVACTRDEWVPGPGGPIRIRIYRPEGEGVFPVMVFYHGSGFVICSVDTHDAMCRQFCRRGRVIVVSVDYRLAPEHPFPAAPDDCLAALRWVAENARQLGGDAARLVLAGDSAGGNLATVTCLRARDENGPAIRAQMLFYPVTDHYSVQRPSYDERATGYGLTRDTMIWFWDQYLPDPAQGAHPFASPIRAASLRDLPPAYVITGEFDPLRDEGQAYADRLALEAVPVDLVRYADMTHGFLNWVGLVDRATEAMDAACVWLQLATR